MAKKINTVDAFNIYLNNEINTCMDNIKSIDKLLESKSISMNIANKVKNEMKLRSHILYEVQRVYAKSKNAI